MSGVVGVTTLGRRRRDSVPPTDDRLDRASRRARREEIAGRRTEGTQGILGRFAAAGHPAMRGSLVAALLLIASFVRQRQRRRLRRVVGEEGT